MQARCRLDASMPGLRTGQLMDRSISHHTWVHCSRALHRHFADVSRVSHWWLRTFRGRLSFREGFTDVSRVFRGGHSMRYARFTNVSQVFRGQYTLCL